jgi:hypothetical protein
MAKKSTTTVMLINETNPETGTKYMVKIPNKGTKQGNKLRFHKYDPVLQTHAWFVQKKLPSHAKK